MHALTTKVGKCHYCKKEECTLYHNPMTVVDLRTGKIVEDYMCKDCLEFTLEELA